MISQLIGAEYDILWKLQTQSISLFLRNTLKIKAQYTLVFEPEKKLQRN